MPAALTVACIEVRLDVHRVTRGASLDDLASPVVQLKEVALDSSKGAGMACDVVSFPGRGDHRTHTQKQISGSWLLHTSRQSRRGAASVLPSARSVGDAGRTSSAMWDVSPTRLAKYSCGSGRSSSASRATLSRCTNPSSTDVVVGIVIPPSSQRRQPQGPGPSCEVQGTWPCAPSHMTDRLLLIVHFWCMIPSMSQFATRRFHVDFGRMECMCCLG